jgi:hypothetical protein
VTPIFSTLHNGLTRGSSHHVVVLWVDMNPLLGGPIPTEFGNFQQLRSLSLTECDFTGTFPSELGTVSSLCKSQLVLEGILSRVIAYPTCTLGFQRNCFCFETDLMERYQANWRSFKIYQSWKFGKTISLASSLLLFAS